MSGKPALIPESWFDRALLDDPRFDYDSFQQCDYDRLGAEHTPAMHAEAVEHFRKGKC